MIKTFLISVILVNFVYAAQQVVLVVSDEFSSSTAKLECFEGTKKRFSTISVNLGKNGIGWGLGEVTLKQKESEPLKFEGDKKSPSGIFKLTQIFGYKQSGSYKMPYLYASRKLICVDDSDSRYYNQIVEMKGDEKSFEYMKRKDHQYELGIVVQHNKNAVAKRGSCIFMHVKKSENASTAGCTSMSLNEIKKISSWLDIEKHPILIQIPKSSSKEILELYPELVESELLK